MARLRPCAYALMVAARCNRTTIMSSTRTRSGVNRLKISWPLPVDGTMSLLAIDGEVTWFAQYGIALVTPQFRINYDTRHTIYRYPSISRVSISGTMRLTVVNRQHGSHIIVARRLFVPMPISATMMNHEQIHSCFASRSVLWLYYGKLTLYHPARATSLNIPNRGSA